MDVGGTRVLFVGNYPQIRMKLDMHTPLHEAIEYLYRARNKASDMGNVIASHQLSIVIYILDQLIRGGEAV